MKKTKLILVLALCFAFFNGCSNEESFIDEVEETTINTKGNSTSASKAPEVPPEETQIAYLLVEYTATATQTDRADVISDWSAYVGLLNILPCPNDIRTEIWVVDAAIYDCPDGVNCGGPKSAAVNGDSDVERAIDIQSNDCNN